MKQYQNKYQNTKNPKPNQPNTKNPNPPTQQTPVTNCSVRVWLFSSACLQQCWVHSGCRGLPAPQRSHREGLGDERRMATVLLRCCWALHQINGAHQQGTGGRHWVIFFTQLQGEIDSLICGMSAETHTHAFHFIYLHVSPFPPILDTILTK